MQYRTHICTQAALTTMFRENRLLMIGQNPTTGAIFLEEPVGRTDLEVTFDYKRSRKQPDLIAVRFWVTTFDPQQRLICPVGSVWWLNFPLGTALNSANPNADPITAYSSKFNPESREAGAALLGLQLYGAVPKAVPKAGRKA